MSDQGEKTCPLCAEEMDLTDQQLKPCKCGYEICVWCWHHILEMAEKDDTEGRCPACRTPYDKEKIVGMAANCERLVAEINMERKKSQKTKTKPPEGRKQLSSVRVIQRNLVYIVGLPLTLADEDLLQQREYFGQYGKVLKVSMSRTATGVIQQFPNNTCSVYITYSKEEEAVRCIQSVHGFMLDGRSLKACFGTTKYCHAWLRNMPCNNPDCLYLHEVGSQEDSFTKDEIISAYTRTRVQQITGATNNMMRCSGSVLPPPVDDYSNNSSASTVKPIVKSASNGSTITGRSSPPNGSSGRSIGLPAAASWGMRSSNMPQAVGSTCLDGPSKPKHETVSGSLAFSTAVVGSNQASSLHGDVASKSCWFEESQVIPSKIKSDKAKPMKQQAAVDGQSMALDKATTGNEIFATVLSNQTSSPLPSKLNECSTANSAVQAGSSMKERAAEADGQIENLCSDFSSVRVNANARNEFSGISRTSSSLSGHNAVKSPDGEVSRQPYREPLISPATDKLTSSVIGECSGKQFDLITDQLSKPVTDNVSEVEEDVLSFDKQRLKDPEVVNRPAYLPNHPHPPSLSRSCSIQDSEASSHVNANADSLYSHTRDGDPSLHQFSSNVASQNGFPWKSISSSIGGDENFDCSLLFPNSGMNHIGRLQGDADCNASFDAGESSIISNILSLDLDSLDDTLTSPQNLVKLLGETDQRSSSLKLSSSRKLQNSNQSRFSFARQEGPTGQAFDVDASFSNFTQFSNNRLSSQHYNDSRKQYVDKMGTVNGFSCNFEEPRTFTSSNAPPPFVMPPVSRGPISAPPGFSVPSRAPPPGFSSTHERMDQSYDILSGNHLLHPSPLLRNSYQAPTMENVGNTGDIEFIDPAILAVGKGRLQGGLDNPVLEMRSNFPQQLSALENEARLQLLMQRSISSQQNLRYPDVGDAFSSLSDAYGISSRLVDQSQVSNLSPFAQLSLQQSRNGLGSNGLWDGWNEVQSGPNLGVAELLRNERLGFNKFYNAGYDEAKFRMPSSGDLFGRTFDM